METCITTYFSTNLCKETATPYLSHSVSLEVFTIDSHHSVVLGSCRCQIQLDCCLSFVCRWPGVWTISAVRPLSTETWQLEISSSLNTRHARSGMREWVVCVEPGGLAYTACFVSCTCTVDAQQQVTSLYFFPTDK